MAIIKPDKPVDALLFDGLHLTNPKCLQITMLLHPTCHWMMYWSFKNPFTSNLKPSPAGLNDVNVWLMDFGSGYVCRWPGPGSALTHRDTVVKASLAVKFQWSRILTKRFFSMKNSDFFPPLLLLSLLVFRPATEDSFFDLIWTKERTGARWKESEEGKRGRVEKTEQQPFIHVI